MAGVIQVPPRPEAVQELFYPVQPRSPPSDNDVARSVHYLNNFVEGHEW